eukprot:9489502-Pyramimonas_sp.AAC.2
MFATSGVGINMSPSEYVADTFKRMSNVTVSTAFSGVGAPEVALESLYLGACHWCNVTASCMVAHRPKCLFAFDCNAACRAELTVLPHGPACVFGDVLDCVAPCVSDILKERGGQLLPDDIVSIVLSDKMASNTAF